MASFNAALQTFLESRTAITNIVSTRLYFQQTPHNETTLPYLVWFIVTDPHEPMYYTNQINAGQPRIQFNLYHSTQHAANEKAEDIRKDIRFYQGAMSTYTVERFYTTGVITLKDPDTGKYVGTFDVNSDYYEP